jgi:hypothetical protein
MLRSAANRLFRGRSTATSVSAVVSAPKVLRNGPARATSNHVRWNTQVLVKPFDLGVDDDGYRIHPACYNCEYFVDYGCECNRWARTEIGGFTVQHYVDEPRPTVSIMGRLSSVIFGPAVEPAAAVNIPVPAGETEIAATGATTRRRGQRDRRITQVEVLELENENNEAEEEPAVEFEAGEPNFDDDEPLAVVDEALERALEAAVKRKQRMLKVRSSTSQSCPLYRHSN